MPKLTIRQQIVVTLAVALLFSTLLTLVSYLAGGQTRDAIAAFAADSAAADGVVTGKQTGMVMVSYAPTWTLRIQFKTDKGVDREVSERVGNTIYDRYEISAPIPVTYVRSKPEWFYIPGTEPTQRDLAISDGMFKYGGMASFASLVAFLALLFAGGEGGAPMRRAAATTKATGAGKPGLASGPRNEFGTRRRN